MIFTPAQAPRLAVVDGCLRYHGQLLLCTYPAGDCDHLPWPLPHPAQGYWSPASWGEALRSALFYARATGLLPADCDHVLLPDGCAFAIGG